MFFASSTVGFYHADIHGDNMPSDAVEISDAVYNAMMAGQGAGQIIAADNNGQPVLVDPPTVPPTLSREDFCRALANTSPQVLTAQQALAAIDTFPPQFYDALADMPQEEQFTAVASWRDTKTVAKTAPLFARLLEYFAQENGLSEAQAQDLADQIFDS